MSKSRRSVKMKMAMDSGERVLSLYRYMTENNMMMEDKNCSTVLAKRMNELEFSNDSIIEDA